MNLKILSVLGVMALMVAVWFFYKEDVSIKPAKPVAPDVSYEVHEIKAVQTNAETGEIEYTLTADSLVTSTDNENELIGAKLAWQVPNAQALELTAKKATHDQETGSIRFFDDFVLHRQGNDTIPSMTIKGSEIVGNTKARIIQSHNPIEVTQGEDQFTAQGFVADVAEGEYDFNTVEIVFDPPERQDKPLF